MSETLPGVKTVAADARVDRVVVGDGAGGEIGAVHRRFAGPTPLQSWNIECDRCGDETTVALRSAPAATSAVFVLLRHVELVHGVQT